jgi:hypothetical protein
MAQMSDDLTTDRHAPFGHVKLIYAKSIANDHELII